MITKRGINKEKLAESICKALDSNTLINTNKNIRKKHNILVKKSLIPKDCSEEDANTKFNFLNIIKNAVDKSKNKIKEDKKLDIKLSDTKKYLTINYENNNFKLKDSRLTDDNSKETTLSDNALIYKYNKNNFKYNFVDLNSYSIGKIIYHN